MKREEFVDAIRNSFKMDDDIVFIYGEKGNETKTEKFNIEDEVSTTFIGHYEVKYEGKIYKFTTYDTSKTDFETIFSDVRNFFKELGVAKWNPSCIKWVNEDSRDSIGKVIRII